MFLWIVIFFCLIDLILISYHIAIENNVGILSITDVSSGIFGIPVKIGRQTLIESLIK